MTYNAGNMIVTWSDSEKAVEVTGISASEKENWWFKGYIGCDKDGNDSETWYIGRNYKYDEDTDTWDIWYGPSTYTDCTSVPVPVKGDTVQYLKAQFIRFVGVCRVYIYDKNNPTVSIVYNTVKSTPSGTLGYQEIKDISFSDDGFSKPDYDSDTYIFRGWTDTTGGDTVLCMTTDMSNLREHFLGTAGITSVSNLYPIPEEEVTEDSPCTSLYPIVLKRTSVKTNTLSWKLYTKFPTSMGHPESNPRLDIGETAFGEGVTFKNSCEYVIDTCTIKYESTKSGSEYVSVEWNSEKNLTPRAYFGAGTTYLPYKDTDNYKDVDYEVIRYIDNNESTVETGFVNYTEGIHQFIGWDKDTSDAGSGYSQTTNAISTLSGLADVSNSPSFYAVWQQCPKISLIISGREKQPDPYYYTEDNRTVAVPIPGTYKFSLSKCWDKVSEKNLSGFSYDGTVYTDKDSANASVYITSYDVRLDPIYPVTATKPTIYLTCNTGYFEDNGYTVEITNYIANLSFDAKVSVTNEELLSLLNIPDDKAYLYAVGDVSGSGSEEDEYSYTDPVFTFKIPSSATLGDFYITATLRPAKFNLVCNGVTQQVSHGVETHFTASDFGRSSDQTLLGFSYTAQEDGDYSYAYPASGLVDFRRASGEYVYDGESLYMYPVWGNKPVGLLLITPEEDTWNILGNLDIQVRATITNASTYKNTQTAAALYSTDGTLETFLTVGTQYVGGVTQFVLTHDGASEKSYVIRLLANPEKKYTFSVRSGEIDFEGTAVNGVPFWEVMPDPIRIMWFQPSGEEEKEISVANRTAASSDVSQTFSGWADSATGTEAVDNIIKWGSGTITLYPLWTYSVKYVLGGGRWSDEAPDSVAGVATCAAAGGNSIEYNIPYDPIHTKYAFDGWRMGGRSVTSPVALGLGVNRLTATWKVANAVAHLASVSYSTSPLERIESGDGSMELVAQIRYDFDWHTVSSDGSDMILSDSGVLRVPEYFVQAPALNQSVIRLIYKEAVVWTHAMIVHNDSAEVLSWTVKAEDLPKVSLKYDKDTGAIVEELDVFRGTITPMYSESQQTQPPYCVKGTDDSGNTIFTFTVPIGEVYDFYMVHIGEDGAVDATDPDVAVTVADTTANVTILPVGETSDNWQATATWININNTVATPIHCWFPFQPIEWATYQVKTDRAGNAYFTRIYTPYITASCDEVSINPNDTIPSVDGTGNVTTSFGSVYVAARAPAGSYMVVFSYLHRADSDTEPQMNKYYIPISVSSVDSDAPVCMIRKYVLGATGDTGVTSKYDQYDKATYVGISDDNKRLEHDLILSYPGVSNLSITKIERGFTSSVTTIPILTKSSEYNYCIDLGTTERISLSVSRTQPTEVDDNGTDQSKWSNGYWFEHVKKFFDEWQNLNYGADGSRSGGYNFIYSPGNKYAFPTLNKNVFTSSQISYSYGRAVVDLQLTFTVATMTPKTNVSAGAVFLFYDQYGRDRNQVLYKKTVYGSSMTLPPSTEVDLEGEGSIKGVITMWALYKLTTGGGSYIGTYPAGSLFTVTDESNEYYFVGVAGKPVMAVVWDSPGTYGISLKEVNEYIKYTPPYLCPYRDPLDTENYYMIAYVVGGGGAGGNCDSNAPYMVSRYNKRTPICMVYNTPMDHVYLASGGNSGGAFSRASQINAEWLSDGYFVAEVGKGADNQDSGSGGASALTYHGRTSTFGSPIRISGGACGQTKESPNANEVGSGKGGEGCLFDKNRDTPKFKITGDDGLWEDGTWFRFLWYWDIAENNSDEDKCLDEKKEIADGFKGGSGTGGSAGVPGIQSKLEINTSGDYGDYPSTVTCAGSGGGAANFSLDLTDIPCFGPGDRTPGVKDGIYTGYVGSYIDLTHDNAMYETGREYKSFEYVSVEYNPNPYGSGYTETYSGSSSASNFMNSHGYSAECANGDMIFPARYKKHFHVRGTAKNYGRYRVELKAKFKIINSPLDYIFGKDEYDSRVLEFQIIPNRVAYLGTGKKMVSTGASPAKNKFNHIDSTSSGAWGYYNWYEPQDRDSDHPMKPKYGGGGASNFPRKILGDQYGHDLPPIGGADGAVVLLFVKK